MAIELALRPAREADVALLAEIERACFVDHWTQESFLQYTCTVAELDGQIAGFLVSREIFPGNGDAPPEREILNLAVTPRFRRFGVATQLLQHEQIYRATLYLEVRESNSAARALYDRFGFREISRRTAYYQHPPETAIVMKMNWC
jgi:ribosomal-protein-alanine N-acetyltransferase